MRRALQTLLSLLLLGAAALPATAAAGERTIVPTASGSATVVYRVAIGSDDAIRAGWLEGHAHVHRLGVDRLRRGARRHSMRLRLSPAVRRRVGRRPRLVLRLAGHERRPPAKAPRGSNGFDAPRTPTAPAPAPAPAPPSDELPPLPVEEDPIPTSCTRYASPTGSDAASGSRAEPFATAQRLVDALAPGDVGCLDAGAYHEPILAIRDGGTAARRVVLRSTPGQRALITGQIWIAESADYVTVAHIDHDATYETPQPRPSPVVNGDHSLFYGIDVWSQNGVCFFLGDKEWGVARWTAIRHNRIHDCGQPGLNRRHGIYIAQAADTLIEGNAIYDNPDRGIQLYPNSQRAVIRNNVLDANGEAVIFSGDYGDASSGNLVEGNLITNSRLRFNVESWWPEGNPIGQDNVVRGNCIAGGAFGELQSPQVGFTAYDNHFADPGYANRAGKDFRLLPGSPCENLAGGAGAS